MAGREGLLAGVREAAEAQAASAARLYMAVAGKLGLGPADARAYDLVRRRGPLTAGEIGLATGLTSGSVTALIDRLEARGFVRRLRDGDDRRRVYVQAETGKTPVMAGFAAELDALNAGYDEATLKVLRGYLLKVAVMAEKAVEGMEG